MYICYYCIQSWEPYIPFFPDINTEIIQTRSAKTILFEPKSSKYKTNDANGALVAPEKTPTKPKAAADGIEKANIVDNKNPKVAPITKSGVTSPPWYPAPKHKVVKNNLTKNGGVAFYSILQNL